LLLPCEHFIKKSKQTDFSEEIYTIDTTFFCKALKDIATKLEHLCEKQTSKIQEKPDAITTNTENKFVS